MFLYRCRFARAPRGHRSDGIARSALKTRSFCNNVMQRPARDGNRGERERIAAGEVSGRWVIRHRHVYRRIYILYTVMAVGKFLNYCAIVHRELAYAVARINALRINCDANFSPGRGGIILPPPRSAPESPCCPTYNVSHKFSRVFASKIF